MKKYPITLLIVLTLTLFALSWISYNYTVLYIIFITAFFITAVATLVLISVKNYD